jgi:hypothetical protein
MLNSIQRARSVAVRRVGVARHRFMPSPAGYRRSSAASRKTALGSSPHMRESGHIHRRAKRPTNIMRDRIRRAAACNLYHRSARPREGQAVHSVDEDPVRRPHRRCRPCRCPCDAPGPCCRELRVPIPLCLPKSHRREASVVRRLGPAHDLLAAGVARSQRHLVWRGNSIRAVPLRSVSCHGTGNRVQPASCSGRMPAPLRLPPPDPAGRCNARSASGRLLRLSSELPATCARPAPQKTA